MSDKEQERELSKISSVLDEYMLGQQMRNSAGVIDFSSLSEQQADKMVDMIIKNEEHNYDYMIKHLEAQSRFEDRRIEASIVNQKTVRYLLLGGGFLLFAVMVLILFFKETYFIPYLTFVTGLAGGVGIKSAAESLTGSRKPRSSDQEDN